MISSRLHHPASLSPAKTIKAGGPDLIVYNDEETGTLIQTEYADLLKHADLFLDVASISLLS